MILHIIATVKESKKIKKSLSTNYTAVIQATVILIKIT